MSAVPASTIDEQSAARELVRDWAASSGAIAAIRAAETENPDAWRPVFAKLAELGLFGVAIPEDRGGAGGAIADLCAMVDEAACALLPGPIVSTALATLVVDDEDLLAELAEGTRTAGLALTAELTWADGAATGVAEHVVGADPAGLLVLPSPAGWLLVDAAAAGVRIEALTPTDFSRPLARVLLDGAPATLLAADAARVRDLAATLFAAEAAGVARWCLDTAVDYAKVREQFGKPIGSFQAVKHLCAEMLIRAEQAAVTAADAARAADAGDPEQLAAAAAVAAAAGIDAAIGNAKDCIQVLGGIGFTWEHDAHLYFRRGYGIGGLLGGREHWLRRTAALTVAGTRRRLGVDLSEVEALRAGIAAEVAAVAALPEEQRQRALAESGLLAPHWPAPYGRDAAPAEQLLIDQELAAAGVERPDISIGWWAAPTILEHGTPEQVARFIPGTLDGSVYWSQLFSEPGAGSDLASLRTKAERVEGGWKLTGQKVWTSNAHRSNWGVCLARTNPDVPKHKGISYFVLDMSSPGIDIRPLREMTGEALFNEVFLDGVFVPDELVIGAVDGGWPLARTTLANERVAMGGVDKGMEELLAHFAGTELDPAAADRLGALIVEGLTGSLLDQRIAELAMGGRDPGAQSSVRKLIGVRYRQALAEQVMETTPGAGLVDNPQTRYFLNTRCLTIAGGTEQILLTVAAERLLGLPR
ncbi:acyl-CoA dehydrogenase FadE34 [Mycolicibacterium fallax]|nr:acyl-CoA dehydrogenase FadE34 [Mycolicibacterium fallax]